MQVNEFPDKPLSLIKINVEQVLIPQLSEAGKEMTKAMVKIENYIKQDDNILMNTLKYSFVLRYLSNNQVIVLSSLLNIKVPINFHIATQALSSGLKPETELYQLSSRPFKEEYPIFFGQTLKQDELTVRTSRIWKFNMSGYTNNLFVNDPFFVMLVILLVLLLIPVSVILGINREKQSRIEFSRSVTYKVFLFIFSTIPDTLEASLLTILITNYRFWESPTLQLTWDLYGFLMLLFVDILVVLFQVLQQRYINQVILQRE